MTSCARHKKFPFQNKLLFHRVMKIVHKSGTSLQFWNLRINHSTYEEIKALWVVLKLQQRYFRYGHRHGPFGQSNTINVWDYISKDNDAKCNVSLSISAKILSHHILIWCPLVLARLAFSLLKPRSSNRFRIPTTTTTDSYIKVTFLKKFDIIA